MYDSIVMIGSYGLCHRASTGSIYQEIFFSFASLAENSRIHEGEGSKTLSISLSIALSIRPKKPLDRLPIGSRSKRRSIGFWGCRGLEFRGF
jgi:hypothetical protein